MGSEKDDVLNSRKDCPLFWKVNNSILFPGVTIFTRLQTKIWFLQIQAKETCKWIQVNFFSNKKRTHPVSRNRDSFPYRVSTRKSRLIEASFKWVMEVDFFFVNSRIEWMVLSLRSLNYFHENIFSRRTMSRINTRFTFDDQASWMTPSVSSYRNVRKWTSSKPNYGLSLMEKLGSITEVSQGI